MDFGMSILNDNIEGDEREIHEECDTMNDLHEKFE